MVKHSTHKRAYNTHRRAYKKRRTVRRLKRTLRRTIQKGGSVVPIFIAIATLVAGDKIISLLKFIQLFTGKGQSGGGGILDKIKTMVTNSNVSNSSMGASISSKGSELKESAKANIQEQAIAALEKLRDSYENESPRDDDALNCISRLIIKLKMPEVAAKINGPYIAGKSLPPPPPSPDVKSIIETGTGGNFTDELVASQNKMEFFKTKISDKLILLKNKVNEYVDKSMDIVKDKTGFDDGDIKCLKILKGKIVNDLTNGLDVKFQNAKAKYPLLESMIQTFVRGKEALKSEASALMESVNLGIGKMFGTSKPIQPTPVTPAQSSGLFSRFGFGKKLLHP